MRGSAAPIAAYGVLSPYKDPPRPHRLRNAMYSQHSHPVSLLLLIGLARRNAIAFGILMSDVYIYFNYRLSRAILNGCAVLSASRQHRNGLSISFDYDVKYTCMSAYLKEFLIEVSMLFHYAFQYSIYWL